MFFVSCRVDPFGACRSHRGSIGSACVRARERERTAL
jgi:hypothetical protein